MDIAVLFQEELKDDAVHAKGVFCEELDFYKVNYEAVGKEKLIVGEVNFHFINVDKTYSKKGIIFKKKQKIDKIYTTKNLQESYERQLEEYNVEYFIHPYPTQSIIDFVMEIKEQIDDEKIVAYEYNKKDNAVKKIKIERFKVDNKRFFDSKEKCQSKYDKIISVQVIKEVDREFVKKKTNKSNKRETVKS